MQLPQALQLAIDRMTESCDMQQLTKAREELTKRYHQPSGSQFITNDTQRQAYVIARMPATYASVLASLTAIRERANLPIKSVLDLGAGPGTAMWAACEIFPEIETVTLIEKDSALLAIGKRLTEMSENGAILSANWQQEDLENFNELPPHDLIVLSYSIGELKAQKIVSLVDLCWKAAPKILLIIEPGTPVGFERIRSIRRELISRGAHLIAPCPHHLSCPMAGGDWCHFSAHVERSFLHRRLKGGVLGHEDEKFSYIAATQPPFPLPDSRILSPPSRHSGHVNLKLCTSNGVQQLTISKKMGSLYKKARKAEWGDTFP